MPKTSKIVVLDLENILVEIIYPAIEMPTYHQVMSGNRILDGEALLCKRNHFKLFFDYLFKNFKVGVWSSSKDQSLINEIIDSLKIRDKIEFVYSIKDCIPQYFEVCGFGYGQHNMKDFNKIKGYTKENILFLEGKKVKCIHNGHVLYVNNYYGCDDDDLLKVMDMLDMFKLKGIKSDYMGDVSYSL